MLIKKLPNVQYPIAAVFAFDHADTMVNVDGVELAFGADDAANTIFDIFTPPPGSVVIGGNVKIQELVTGSTTSTIDVGDSDDRDRYTETGAIDLKDADAPASGFEMLGDHKVYGGNQAVSISLLNDVAMTAGKVIVTVLMVTPGKANENLKTV